MTWPEFTQHCEREDIPHGGGGKHSPTTFEQRFDKEFPHGVYHLHVSNGKVTDEPDEKRVSGISVKITDKVKSFFKNEIEEQIEMLEKELKIAQRLPESRYQGGYVGALYFAITNLKKRIQ